MSYGSKYSRIKYPEIISYQKFLRVKCGAVSDNTFTEKEVQVPADLTEGKVFAIHSVEFEQPKLSADGDKFILQLSLKEEGAVVNLDDRDLLFKHEEEYKVSGTAGLDGQVKTRTLNFYPPLVCSKDKLFIGVVQKTGSSKDIFLRIGFSLRWMNPQSINALALDQLQ